ncbi:DUF6090 family protein [Algoriphagus namhaensis]|uniref:DUF6090 family protein n=1 Tax=Algoriphagus namhaensis TaxID=915353 RepID=A0ABV8AS87_9BACT
MLKFFRKIRQNLLSEGRTGKYIKYAFGEIVLVMIGILLALQVNNWNESRKNNILRKSIIDNLITDLQKDIENLHSLNEINTAAEKEGEYLASFLKEELNEIDTLRLTNSIVICGYVPNKSIISSTYNELINSNNFHLFKDATLKRLLDEYYNPNSWSDLLNSRILKTIWYDYRDEMSKFHSPLLYQDYYEFQEPIISNPSKYNVQWNQIQDNDYIKTQVGMIAAYRIVIRQDFERYIQKATITLDYLKNSR